MEKFGGGDPPQIFPLTGGIWGGQGFPHAKLRPRRNFGDFEPENAEIFVGGTLFFSFGNLITFVVIKSDWFSMKK